MKYLIIKCFFMFLFLIGLVRDAGTVGPDLDYPYNKNDKGFIVLNLAKIDNNNFAVRFLYLDSHIDDAAKDARNILNGGVNFVISDKLMKIYKREAIRIDFDLKGDTYRMHKNSMKFFMYGRRETKL